MCMDPDLIIFQMVKLLFKTPSKQQPITLQVNLAVVRTVQQLKQEVANQANSTVPNIKLIHKGKILKDDTQLQTLKLIQGETFHAVIKVPENPNKPATQPPPTNNTGSTGPQPATNPFGGLGGLGGMGGMGGLGGMGGMGGMGGFGGMGGGMGGMGNMDPQAMASMMDMLTPEMMQQMVNSNPMLKNMADSNPQVKAMISNPQLMKQMLGQINPAQMQAAMSQMGGLGGLGGGGLGGYGGMGGMGGFGGLGGVGTGVSPQTNANVDYKTLFAEQLTQLQGMGFTNQTTNIEVLKQTGGNVEAAVERLLNMLG